MIRLQVWRKDVVGCGEECRPELYVFEVKSVAYGYTIHWCGTSEAERDEDGQSPRPEERV
jgi:hypothetical protein